MIYEREDLPGSDESRADSHRSHSEAALRRAARIGDGWMHAGSDDLDFCSRA